MTFLRGKGVWGQNFLSICLYICPIVRPSCDHLLNHRKNFNQTSDVSDGRFGIIVSIPDHCLPFYFVKNRLVAICLSRVVRVCEWNIIFPSVHLSVCPSVHPSRYLILNHWAEFNQTCYMSAPMVIKGVWEQHYFFACLSVCSFITLSPAKSLGGISPNLLHNFPAW